MTLEHYAFRIAGPIDFVINLAINAAIPLFFLWNVRAVPTFGLPSAYVFLGPMVFCVLVFATFFGHLNGVVQRGRGLGDGPIPPATPWARVAWLTGVKYAMVGLAAITLTCLAIQYLWPAVLIPTWIVVVVDGLGSAGLGYSAQVNGVLRTRRF